MIKGTVHVSNLAVTKHTVAIASQSQTELLSKLQYTTS